jgi:hypothetical protein
VNEAIGEAILTQAVEQARQTWGPRLLAAYALGSLAHGGFSDLVSDVDLGLVLGDPLAPEDAARVAAVGERVRAGGAPLAERLSIFWATPAILRGTSEGGRFPPLDRLDLLRYGRLLSARDAREGMAVPDTRALVLAATEQALRGLSTPEVLAELTDPAGLVAAGARHLTKRILFPVRFLYTAQTGAIGRNHDAVAHFVRVESGPAVPLVDASLRWRETPPAADDAAAVALVGAGMLPLYRRFVTDHEQRMQEYGEAALARRLAAWRAGLDDLPQ